MPRDLDHFTKCAAPGNEEEAPIGSIILAFIAVGGLLGFIAWAGVSNAENAPCSPLGYGIIVGLVTGLTVALNAFERWYYNNRLMCIRPSQCAVGTVVGDPKAACDGDRKLDLLIAPFSPREVDGPLMSQAVRTLASADSSFPPVPDDLESNRDRRVEFVQQTLSLEQRRRVYLELVHNLMLRPGRDFQSRYYRREPPPVMDQDAFDRSPLDRPSDPSPNPLFKYDGQEEAEAGENVEALCRVIVGFDEEEESRTRLIPFLHCEVEGDRIGATMTAIIVALFSWLVLYAIGCIICEALGGNPIVCGPIVGLLTLLLAALLFFLFRELLQDGTEAGEIPVDIADPTATDSSSTTAAGDVVFVFGNWIKDMEHSQYYEIHPVKAWYLICRDAGNVPTLSEPGREGCVFDVTSLTTDAQVTDVARRQDIICSMLTSAETKDPEQILRLSTSSALSMAGGIANVF